MSTPPWTTKAIVVRPLTEVARHEQIVRAGTALRIGFPPRFLDLSARLPDNPRLFRIPR